MNEDQKWYKDAIFYELHVKAFQDGNGDGVGDFKGLVTRLEYLHALGIDCIWLLPFYPSPLRDDGYDIADYCGVHPNYGNIQDFQAFLDEAHRLGIRVIADLVLNHTSDQHMWFQRARRAPKGSPERDWYVWSDTDERYADARIIFTDTEPSNWTWDPVAGQYYWHRFFSHQPDLNWDNPQVKETMFQVMEYWLDRGLDGFRADAVPYLIEREGTICENLPETHAILKEFRARMDAKYPGRILLAEANQWPADVCHYFGNGDEFHMAFHFPLMPRIFMAVRQGIRQPIVDIIEQTPPIPEDCQWCMFLRNHDELTLEMVTDEERDYMYQEYAADPRMRLNMGIRRRLAPLMENDRRKIELLNSILFTMPGTPIVYYGDEIGMGDNIYLGDRDGVRTPMQWSPDRNAGFSRAEPERLYLPVINDSVYGFQAVNVEAQLRSPFSLLNWMKRLIQVRKAHRALGRGTIEFLRPENQHVLAYLREYEGDTVLVVNNLSASAQPVQLDLQRFAGRVPVELLGATRFMPIDTSPYPMTLAPYGFFWFALRQPDVDQSELDEVRLAQLSREWAEEDGTLIEDPETVAGLLGKISMAWLHGQRWFRSKTADITAVEGMDFASVHPDRGPSLVLAIIHVRYTTSPSEYYTVPVTFRPPLKDADSMPILTVPMTSRDLSLYDALRDPSAALAMHRIIELEEEVRGREGVFRGVRTPAFESYSGTSVQVRPLEGEQSNSNITFGETSILKVFRKLETGENPDLEVSRFLAERTDFRAFPALQGWIEYSSESGFGASVAALFRYIPNRGDAWSWTLRNLDRFFGAASRSAADPLSSTGKAALRRMAGDYFAVVEKLGVLTADLHRALASGDSTRPEFVPEPTTVDDAGRWIDEIRIRGEAVLDDVGRRLDAMPTALPTGMNNQLAGVVRERINLLRRAEALRELASGRVLKSRIHGDLHLGQVLRARDPGPEGEWIVVDFEGEPARPLAVRRQKYSPLRDVAGMLRSFDYAVHVATANFRTEDFMARTAVRNWGAAWLEMVRTTFLDSYRRAAEGSGFLPADDDTFHRVLGAFELEKALYELGYEMNNRPDWLWIPMQGILAISERSE